MMNLAGYRFSETLYQGTRTLVYRGIRDCACHIAKPVQLKPQNIFYRDASRFWNAEGDTNLKQKVSERTIKLESALQKLQKFQLQLVQHEKMATLGNLIAGVAHEINNPMGFIDGNLNAAREHLQDLLAIIALYQENASVSDAIIATIEDIDLNFIKEDFPKLIASMQCGCDRIASISTSLRTFSRTDTDAKTEFDPHEGMDSTLLILKYRLKANEQRPAIEIVKKYGNIPAIKCYA